MSVQTVKKVKNLALEIGRDSQKAAQIAGLEYVDDAEPGITRKRSGKGFSYQSAQGQVVKDAKTLSRIRALAIPPAYQRVWICPQSNGHIQATGYDEKGRKQYRYHERWRAIRDDTKFARMIVFAHNLPKIRARTEQDLKKTGFPREKVLAAIVQLLEKTAIRVGNEEYVRANNSYGLTTMRNRHAKVEGSGVHFHFKGKSGKWHDIDLHHRQLSRIVRKLQELPGQKLFQYRENGELHSVTSGDVNSYLREVTGQDFTAKDFRTWAGTVAASLALQELEKFENAFDAQRNIFAAVKSVAQKLGNTPAVCRKSYIHPAIFECYLDGSMLKFLQQGMANEPNSETLQLKPEESAVLRLLQGRQRFQMKKEQESR